MLTLDPWRNTPNPNPNSGPRHPATILTDGLQEKVIDGLQEKVIDGLQGKYQELDLEIRDIPRKG